MTVKGLPHSPARWGLEAGSTSSSGEQFAILLLMIDQILHCGGEVDSERSGHGAGIVPRPQFLDNASAALLEGPQLTDQRLVLSEERLPRLESFSVVVQLELGVKEPLLAGKMRCQLRKEPVDLVETGDQAADCRWKSGIGGCEPAETQEPQANPPVFLEEYLILQYG